jgi:hypothetical protein
MHFSKSGHLKVSALDRFDQKDAFAFVTGDPERMYIIEHVFLVNLFGTVPC